MKKKLLFALALLLMFSAIEGIGQETSKAFEFVKDKNQYTTKIVFKQGQKRGTKELILSELNPYDDFDLDTVVLKTTPFKTFKLENKKKASKKMSYYLRKYPDANYSNLYSTSSSQCHINGNYLVVCFTVVFGDISSFYANSRHSTIYIYNKDGTLLQTFEDLPYDANEPKITSDGKYLGFSYGGEVYHNDEKFERGFKIFQVDNKEIFFEKVNIGFRWGCKSNVFTIHGKNSKERYFFISHYNLLVFKNLTNEQLKYSYKYQHNGIAVDDYKGNKYFLNYKTDFEIIKQK